MRLDRGDLAGARPSSASGPPWARAFAGLASEALDSQGAGWASLRRVARVSPVAYVNRWISPLAPAATAHLPTFSRPP